MSLPLSNASSRVVSQRAGVRLLTVQAVLTTLLASYFLVSGNQYRLVASGAALLYATMAVAYRRGHAAAPAVAVITTAVLIGFFTEEPFITQQIGLGILIPGVLATVLLSPVLIVVTMGAQWAILLGRGGGQGVLIQPMNVVLGVMVTGGLAFARALTDAALRTANDQAQRAQAALAISTHQRHENEALQERLMQAQKLESLGQLAGGVAHDFNNLLTAILNFTILARDCLQNQPEVARQHLDQVSRAGDRAASLTRQLLAFARRQHLDKRDVNLAVVVQDAQPMLARLLGSHFHLVPLIESNLRPVRADPGQIERVLTNLVFNARDALPDGGQIEILVRNVDVVKGSETAQRGIRPGLYVSLTVADHGVGMAPDLCNKIFEPFFTTKTVDRGTGLGLSTCMGIVQQHDGFILVDSQLGHGTSIRVLLPGLTQPQPPGPEAPVGITAPAADTRRHVVLVEDEPMVRQVTAQILKDAGFDVRTAVDAEQALTQLADPDLPAPDLLLTDLMMPGLGGEVLAERARVHVPGLAVLFMTGYAASAPATTTSKGPTALIEKPFMPARLISRINELLLDRPRK